MNVKPGELCGTVRQTAANRSPRRAGGKVALESLEARRLFTTATLGSDGILTFVGTFRNDDIRIYADPLDPTAVNWDDGWPAWPVHFAGVRGIRVDGGGGDDYISISGGMQLLSDFDGLGHYVGDRWYGDVPLPPRFDIPVTVHGGAGDDIIYCESTGDDVLIGDGGKDHATASDGNDLFSTESVEDERFGRNKHFVWRSAGDRLFANPFETIIYEGTYWGPDYLVQPVKPTPVDPTPVDPTPVDDNTTDAQDGQEIQGTADVTPVTTGDDSSDVPDDVTAPPAVAVIAPPALAVFSTTPIKPAHGHVWDDASEA